MAQEPPISAPNFVAANSASPSVPGPLQPPSLPHLAHQSPSHAPISFPSLIRPPAIPGSSTQPISTPSQQAPVTPLQPATPVIPYSQLTVTHPSFQPAASAASAAPAPHVPRYQGVPYSGFLTALVNAARMQSSLAASNVSCSHSRNSRPYENLLPAALPGSHVGVVSGAFTTLHIEVHPSRVSSTAALASSYRYLAH